VANPEAAELRLDGLEEAAFVKALDGAKGKRVTRWEAFWVEVDASVVVVKEAIMEGRGMVSSYTKAAMRSGVKNRYRYESKKVTGLALL